MCRRAGMGVSRDFGSKGQACRENLISPHLLPRGLQPNPGAEVAGRGRKTTLQRAKDSGKRILSWKLLEHGLSSSGQG